MKIKRTMEYEVRFLPNKRCKKTRRIVREKKVEFEVLEPKKEEFPVAFIVHKHGTIYPNMKTYKDFENNKDNNEYKLYAEEIRCFKDQLYRPIRVTHGAAISTLYETNPKIAIRLNAINIPYDKQEDKVLFSEEAIIESTNEQLAWDCMNKSCENYKYFNGRFWVRCGEPYYVSQNGCLFVEDRSFGRESMVLERYEFNAFERKKVLEKVTNEFSAECQIEVLMPEMVKLYHPRVLNVTVYCQAYYTSQIELPKDFNGTYEDAIAYAEAHIKEIPLGELEYISDSDELDVENCSFDE